MPLKIVRSDIINVEAQAIVNAANSGLRCGGGVCGRIFQAAGVTSLTEACRKLAPCETGHAVITPGFKLKQKYVIHAVGPIWQDGKHKEEQQLISCYKESLRLAAQKKLTSVAFPLISAGIYGYPRPEAMRTAVKAIREYLRDEDPLDMNVILVLYDHDSYLTGTAIYGDITSYISDHEIIPDYRRGIAFNAPCAPSRIDAEAALSAPAAYQADGAEPCQEELSCAAPIPKFSEKKKMYSEDAHSRLAAWMKKQKTGSTFSDYLRELAAASGASDKQIYIGSNIDRKLYSKIMGKKEYRPRKNTVLALTIGLHLDHEHAALLLQKAGYAFTNASRLDLVVQWCLQNRYWDIDDLNMILEDMDLPQLPDNP